MNKKGIRIGGFLSLGQLKKQSSESPLLTALARSAEDLTVGTGWPDGINALLEDLGRITGVSRVWIFQVLELTEDYILQENTFEWVKSSKYIQLGLPEFTKFKGHFDAPEYKDIIDSRLRGEWQKVIVRKLSPSWLKKDLEKQEIKSMLTIPINVEGKWWGVLGFDDCEREYDWDDSEIAALRAAGYLISSAVLRDRLSAKRKQYSILQKITSCSSWEFDFKKSHLWCNSEIFQSTPGKSENLYFSFRGILKKVHSNDRKDFLSSILKFVSGQEDAYRKDIRVMANNHEYRWVEVIGNISKDSSGQAEQFAGIAVDIRSRKEHEQATELLARTDPLTGLPNRRAFFEHANQEIARFRRDSQQQLAVILMDIDYFKRINDTYGHDVGDIALKELAKLIKKEIRSSDVAARFGGEEFVMLLSNTGDKYAEKFAERLRKKIAKLKIPVKDKIISFTASFGISACKSKDTNVDELITRSDQALYRAKGSGRNCVIISDH